jgi:hypothetical protein
MKMSNKIKLTEKQIVAINKLATKQSVLRNELSIVDDSLNSIISIIAETGGVIEYAEVSINGDELVFG